MDTPHAKNQPLAGRRVLICRPEPEAGRLADCFRAAGADVRLLPLIARQPLPEAPTVRTILQDLDLYSHVIAVSPYAARLFLEYLDEWWPQVPMGIHWYAVGSGTAAVLASYGLQPQQPETGWSSEQLLKLPSLCGPAGEKVLLVRGEEGRELLAQTLTKRGARVTLLPLYRRYCPEYDSATLNGCLNDFEPEAIITLSAETLNNLIALSKNTGHNLEHALLVVPVERVAEIAREAGLQRPCIPVSLADEDIVATVAQQLTGRVQAPDNPSKDTRDRIKRPTARYD